MIKKLTNSFATKKDIQRLETQINRRFTQVDRRFCQFDKRIGGVEKQMGQLNRHFSVFKDDLKQELELFKKDTFREFEHKWQQQIDPILKEIVYHREKESLVYNQYQRIETLLLQVADKVGVKGQD